MEFGLDLASQIIHCSASWRSPAPDRTASRPAVGVATKYAVARANGIGLPIVVDGVNEAGLAGGLLYCRMSRSTRTSRKLMPGRRSPPTNCCTLTNFATVAEARRASRRSR